MTTISLCMIVKDEESMLPRCLASVRDWVDEIIVVDTGSTDRTVAIAEDCGAKVYHHPWENDFSKHRNQSLSYASGDWILIMDADEELAKGHGIKIRTIASKSHPGVSKIYFIIKNIKNEKISMVTTSLRLFRNHIGSHYKGIVHNLIVVPEGERLTSDVVLYHYGYGLTSEAMEKKFQRTYSLLNEQLDEHPDDLYALYNMATTLFRKNPQKCIDYGFRLLSHLKEKGNAPVFYINIFYVLAATYVHMKEIEKAIDLCLEAVNLFPRYLDAYWILCETYFDKNDHAKVIEYGCKFLKCRGYLDNHPEELSDLFMYSYDQEDKVRLRLGLSYIYENDWASAKPHLRAYVISQEGGINSSRIILSHLQSHHADFGSIKGKIHELLNLPESAGTPRTQESTETEPSSISLCMIVKNEEALLPQCLNSVKDFVDETIVVDTGSTDKTVEIAEHYGAKVYHHPWENDFSKHRNHSISYAQGDWILIMDADEVLRKGDGPKIRDVVANSEIDSVLVTVVNYFNQGTAQSWANQVRLFRRKPEIFYDGIVHNQLSGYHSPMSCPVYIYHYGYDLVPKMMEAKFERTSSLLKKRIEQNPEDFRHYHDLCVSYSMNFMFEEAISTGLKAISLAAKAKGNGGVLVLWTYFIVASSYLKLGNAQDAEKSALEALKICPDHLDCNFILSIVYHELGDRIRFEEYSANYLKILGILRSNPERFGYTVNNTAFEEWRIHLAQGDFCLCDGQADEAQRAFGLALESSPDKAKCHRSVASLYRNRKSWDSAEKHYQLADMMEEESGETLLGMAVLYRLKGDSSKYREMVDRMRQLESTNKDILTEIGICDLAQERYVSAVSNFEKALHNSPFDAEICTYLALTFKHLGRIEEASDWYLKALELDENSLGARISLGDIYFEQGSYDDAARMYAGANELKPDFIHASLRLARVLIVQGYAEGCVAACESIFKALNIPDDMVINSIVDLAQVFLVISQYLRDQGDADLSSDALQIAYGLSPQCDSTTASHQPSAG